MSPDKLSLDVVKELEESRNELWLSPISIWETMILVEKKRIVLRIPVKKWLKTALSQVPVQEAPLTHEIAIKSQEIELPHKDPADRFIVATACVNRFTLVTADKNIASSREVSCLLN